MPRPDRVSLVQAASAGDRRTRSQGGRSRSLLDVLDLLGGSAFDQEAQKPDVGPKPGRELVWYIITAQGETRSKDGPTVPTRHPPAPSEHGHDPAEARPASTYLNVAIATMMAPTAAAAGIGPRVAPLVSDQDQ